MVVMDPYEILCRQHWCQSSRKHLIDTQIAGEIAPRELDKFAPVMEQRPKNAIGVTDIIFIVIPTREVERCEGEEAIDRDPRFIGRLLCDRSTPAEPNAAALLQSGAYRHGKAT